MTSDTRPRRTGLRWWLVMLCCAAIVALFLLRGRVSPGDQASSSSVESLHVSPGTPNASFLIDDRRGPSGQRDEVEIDGSTAVVTIDEHGDLIPGVDVFVHVGGAWSAVGQTDSRGMVRVRLPDEEIVLCAKAKDRVATRLDSTAPHAKRIEIALPSGGSICGRVVTRTGEVPNAPIRIVGSPYGVVETVREILARLRARDPAVVVTDIDENGRFCLTSVDPGEAMQLTCGGGGFAMREGALRVGRSGDVDLVLEVERVFGATVHFVDESGAAPDFSHLCHQPQETWSEEGGVVPTHLGLATVLAGVDPEYLDVPESWRVLLFQSSSPLDFVGPIRLDHELAGFVSGSEFFRASAVSKGFEDVLVQLRSEVAARSSVDIEFRAASDLDVQDSTTRQVTGALELTREDGRTWSFAIVAPRAGKETIRGVPIGSYRARFRSRTFVQPPLDEPPVPFDVVEGGSRFVVDLDRVGRIRLDLRRRNEDPYQGRVQLLLMRGRMQRQPDDRTTAQSQVVRAVRPPYVIDGLEPGEYSIWTTTPSFLSETGERSLVVQVAAGVESVVAGTLAR